MKLITNEQQDQLLANGRAVMEAIRAGIAVDPTPLVKLHTPDGFAVWLLTELNPHGGDCAYGLCDLGYGRPALGYVLLTVIDVATAETNPGAGAILENTAAGCAPVRTTESADNKTVWVSARGDNRVLAFSASMLESNPDQALVGYADSNGTAPVGIRLFHNDQFLAIANSNRFNTGVANATILNVASPATASVLATIMTGSFPREIDVGPDDATLYLTNYSSETFQVIKITGELIHPGS